MAKLGDKCFELLKAYIESRASAAILVTFSRLLLRDLSNPVLQTANITMQVCLQLKNAQNFEGSGRPKCCIVLQWHAEVPTLSFARIALASVVSMVSFSSCNSASLLLLFVC